MNNLREHYTGIKGIDICNVEGVPNGYCFYHKSSREDVKDFTGYLIAVKDGVSDKVSTMPVFNNDIVEAGKQILPYYEKL